MGIISNFLYGKNKKGVFLACENSDEGHLYMIYDKNVNKDNFYIYFSERENKKYYSKDINDFQIVNQKEIQGLFDYVLGPTNAKYIKISFKDGTNKIYETKSWEKDRLKAIEFFDKYHQK